SASSRSSRCWCDGRSARLAVVCWSTSPDGSGPAHGISRMRSCPRCCAASNPGSRRWSAIWIDPSRRRPPSPCWPRSLPPFTDPAGGAQEGDRPPRRRRRPPSAGASAERDASKEGRTMGLLDALLGAGQSREDSQGFLQRFEQGQPWEGYSDQEVLKRYGTVAQQASPQEYEQAASEAFARMSPEQRVEFGPRLQERAREQKPGIGALERSQIGDFQDARSLARLTSQVHEQPGLLRSLLGGGNDPQGQQAGLLGNPIAKAALAGIAAMAIKHVLGGPTAQASAGAAPTGTGTATPGTTTSNIPPPPPAQEARTQDVRTQDARTQAQAQPAKATGGERWYEVVRGDSLSKIAAKHYGDGN